MSEFVTVLKVFTQGFHLCTEAGVLHSFALFPGDCLA